MKSETQKSKIMYLEKKMPLTEMQEFVGGLIEIIQLKKDLDLIVNEEGKIIGLPINNSATILAKKYNRDFLTPIVGNALVVGPNSFQEIKNKSEDL